MIVEATWTWARAHRVLIVALILSFKYTSSMQFQQRKNCSHALGLENKLIQDKQLSASSYLQYFFTKGKTRHMRAHYGRLQSHLAWCSQTVTNVHFDVDLYNQTVITGVSTQGYDNGYYHYYIKKYELLLSNDTKSWMQVSTTPNSEVIIGNANGNAVVHHEFPPIRARYVRLVPLSYNLKICLRLELYGCRDVDGSTLSSFSTVSPKPTPSVTTVLTSTMSQQDTPQPPSQSPSNISPYKTSVRPLSSTPVNSPGIVFSTNPDNDGEGHKSYLESKGTQTTSWIGLGLGLVFVVLLMLLVVVMFARKKILSKPHARLDETPDNSLDTILDDDPEMVSEETPKYDTIVSLQEV